MNSQWETDTKHWLSKGQLNKIKKKKKANPHGQAKQGASSTAPGQGKQWAGAVTSDLAGFERHPVDPQ